MPRFAATIFLSAFLLFAVQPLMGKYILPWFGGGSGVWTTCMMFFQAALVAGYGYAYAMDRWLTARKQAIVHTLLLASAAAFLPIMPAESLKPVGEADPVIGITWLLAVTVGLPLIALSATGPLLQAWFSRARPGRSPYRLYALSNAGSLLALVGYPFLFEPLMTRRAQGQAWSILFGIFALICAYTAWRSVAVTRNAATSPFSESSQPSLSPVTRFTKVLWVLLPMCASVALISSTTQLTQDIAPVPFLWILPLTVYLLSFIVCFERPGLYRRTVFVPLLVGTTWGSLMLTTQANLGIAAQVAIFAGLLAVICMACHGELYRLRPSHERLTSYYLAIAVGGALGGVFESVVAPRLLSSHTEFYWSIFAACGLVMVRLFADAASPMHRGARRPLWLTMALVITGAAFMLQRKLIDLDHDVKLHTRNFYGALKIRVQRSTDGRDAELRVLEHGWIRHGAQMMDPEFRRWPTLYYGPDSGVGMVMRFIHADRPRRVGNVGLGVGTLATYGEAGDVFRFYEINPEVKRLADTYFTFLSETDAKVEIVLGDARLSMEREEPQHYDVLVLDAFSGDAIPLHLLTREAFETYLRHLNADGVIAVHISNKFLDLAPILRRMADELGMQWAPIHSPAIGDKLIADAQWVLMCRDPKTLRAEEIVQATGKSSGARDVPLWTDEHASLLPALR